MRAACGRARAAGAAEYAYPKRAGCLPLAQALRWTIEPESAPAEYRRLCEEHVNLLDRRAGMQDFFFDGANVLTGNRRVFFIRSRAFAPLRCRWEP